MGNNVRSRCIINSVPVEIRLRILDEVAGSGSAFLGLNPAYASTVLSLMSVCKDWKVPSHAPFLSS
jgi:hypothetical protein